MTETNTARLSMLGITLGGVALLLAVIHFWAGPFSPQPSLERTVAETATAIRDAAVAAVRGEELADAPQGNDYDLDKGIEILAAVLGGCAIILGAVGFARGEPGRAAGSAAALGAGTIALQFAILALGAIVLLVLIFALLSQLGLG